LAAALLVVAAAVAVFAWARGSDDAPEEQAAPEVAASPTPTPEETPDRQRERPKRTPTPSADKGRAATGGLAVGITEPNANLFRQGTVVGPFARWRDELHRMRPSYYRMNVDWPTYGGNSGRRIRFNQRQHGCMRDIPPCGGFEGVSDQLASAAAAQRAIGADRWQVMIVISGTPARLARGPSGCERRGIEPRSRPITPEGLETYKRFVVALLDEGRRQGLDIRYLSPWNEPNYPVFISPQRAACTPSAKSLAIGAYAELAQAMKQTLDDYPGTQELVLGETAGLLERRVSYTGVGEFIRGLPRDLVCSAHAYGQHGYIGDPDPVPAAAQALNSFDCPRRPEIWMTETGLRPPKRKADQAAGSAFRRRACRRMHRQLLRWYEDKRVSAAFQYTFREDDLFPTGLVTTDLSAAYPVLREWQAWGDREPAGPPPAATCAA
jgi:hypothetical protein